MEICKIEKKREVVDVDYEVCDNKYCCDLMEKWLRIDTYGRNNLKYNPHKGRFNICVRESSGYDCCYDDDDKTKEAAYEDLDYCPFCGEKLQEKKIIKVKKSWRKKK